MSRRGGKGGPLKIVLPIVNIVGIIVGLIAGGKGRKRRRDEVRRACIECDEVYVGGLACPACGAPGEPLGDE